MEKDDIIWGIVIILVLLSILFFLLLSNQQLKSDEQEVLNSITFMEENNLTIYGSTNCGYCKKQIEEFKEYGETLKSDGLFVYCDLNPTNKGCSDITSVPLWKQNNEIVHVGLLKLNQIEETFIQLQGGDNDGN